MIPIEKNIVVVDDRGNVYEATYPKRAKGLVKNGRARFIEENKICLACPPRIYLEDKIMSDNNTTPEEIAISMNDEINKALMENPQADVGEIICDEVASKPTGKLKDETKSIPETKLSINYVLEQIEKISTQTQYLDQVILELRQTHAVGSGDVGTSSKSDALGDIVKSRETTNQQLLKFYEKVYDDLKPKPSLKEKALQTIERTLNNPTCSDTEIETLKGIMETIRRFDDSTKSQSLTSKFSEITDWAKSLNRDEYDPVTWEAIIQSLKGQLLRSF